MPRIKITAYIDVDDMALEDRDDSSDTGVSNKYFDEINDALMNIGAEDIDVKHED